MANLSKTRATRFFNLALGKFDNFTHKTDGLIGLGDGTPSVALNSLLWANSNGTLDITYFDDPAEGQLVFIGNLGAGGVNFNGANMYEQTSNSLLTNEFAGFIHHNSSWYEIFRSDQNVADEATTLVPVSATDARWTGTSTGNFDVTGLSFVNVLTGGGVIMRGLSGGVAGQRLTILAGGAGACTLTGCSGGGAGTFLSGSAGDLVMAASQSVTMIKSLNNLWCIDGSLLSQI